MTENNEIKCQLDKVLDEYKQKSKYYETELKKLTLDLESTRATLNDNLSQNSDLNGKNSHLSDENKRLRELSINQKVEIEDLTEKLDKFKMLHETSMNDSQLELKVKLEMLNQELNTKWTGTLK